VNPTARGATFLADWTTIVRDHGPMAFTTAWRILRDAGDAEDAVQEAFMDALRLQRRGAATGNDATGSGVADWGALLRRLSACRALDRLRRRRPTAVLATDPRAPCGDQPEALALAAEKAAQLRLALAELPAREAEVFALRYFGDLGNGDIARALAISPEAVAVALCKARRRLEEKLRD
jgi:RNA polymerase sigma-70 factor (ECF subfamily)